ncbi:MAG TPA: glucosaminidase domain-containing protein [Wenzhouxiangellaceae bacterium]|nr:glucosaminidase domain-containing protein [Wenzhouxiangellaceae bacterium]
MTEDKPQSQNSRTHATRITDQLRRALAATAIVVGLAVVLAALFSQAPQRLPDFSTISDISDRKQAFFEFLAPVVEAENERVLAQRARLLDLAERVRAGERAGWLDRRWLDSLAEEYAVVWNPDLTESERLESLAMLERRVDAVPVPLALVQAATESGWGRSRFATEGNNLFGHWCYESGCGLVPARRNPDAAHEVAAFDSVSESVSRYLHNLNTHAAYAPLRAIRARLRRQGESLTAMALADGLMLYSERREDYVEEIKTVIRINRPIIARVRETL